MSADKRKTKDNLAVIDSIVEKVSIAIEDADINKFSMIIHLLSRTPDFRDSRLIRYDVSEILGIIIMAKLKTRASSFLAMEAYGIADYEYLKKVGIAKGEKCPSHDTFRRFITCLDGEKMKELCFKELDDMCAIANSVVGNRGLTILSGDGKSNRGTGRLNGARNVNILNILDLSSGACIESIPIGEKESEIPAFQGALGSMDLHNTVITGDALHCNKKTCEIINKRNGFYMFALKENNPEAYSELVTRFEQYANGSRTIGEYHQFERNDRRYEIIVLKRTDISSIWPKVRAYVKMFSRTHDKKTWAEPQYFLTSLKDPDTIMEVIERRWEIEGDYHFFKDEVLREDEQTFMSPEANKNMAILNSILYRLFKLSQHIFRDKSLQITKMRFQVRPLETIEETLLTLKTLNLSEKIQEICR